MFFQLPALLISTARLILLLGAAIGGLLASPFTANAGPQGPTSWAVIKCKFSDQPQEPTFDPSFITSNAGMAGYWRDASYGQISLDGTATSGWYTMGITLAQGQAMTRKQRIDACIAAATNVNTSKFYGVIAILNAKIDSGSQGGRVLLDPDAWFVSFAAHEMGHCYGLDHTFDEAAVSYDPNSDGRPGAYGDGWDIMSAMTFGNSNPVFAGTYGNSGPGLTTLNLDKLGWLTADRISTWDGTSKTVTLAAVNHPEANGFLMTKVPIDAANPNHYYSVEFRRKTGWDAGIPQDTVLIHELRPDGLFQLIRADGGAERLQDQTFHDLNNNVAITVLNINSASSTATINIGRNEVWVDFNHQGQPQLGTFDLPFGTLAAGVNAVAYNGTLRVKAGSRNETATINKKMRIEAYGGPVTIGR